MPNTDIASAIERGITSQSELITSLSVAVIGGLFLLLKLHMSGAAQAGQPVQLRWLPLFYVSLACLAISIGLGYVLSGMLVQMAPQMFSHSFNTGQKFTDQNFGPAPVGLLTLISLLQFIIFFFGGILPGTAFLLRNMIPIRR